MKPITIQFTINGQSHRLATAPNRTLLCVLRNDLGLTSVKDACGQEGECGACTVLLDDAPVNSCLVLIGQVDGRRVLTVEGLGSAGHLHPLQRLLVESGAVQCGYCTPGMLLSAYALLQHTSHPDEEQIRQALAGNLCRCTGYTRIVAAVQAAGQLTTQEVSHAH